MTEGLPTAKPQTTPGSDSSPVLSAGAPARPYGAFGLVVSSVVILLASAAVCALLLAVAFGIAAAMLGLQRALDLAFIFDPSRAADKGFFMKLNIVAGLIIYGVVSAAVLAAARVRGESQWRDLVAWRPWHPFRGARPFWILFAVTLVYSIGADRLVTHVHPQAQDWTLVPAGVVWDVLFVGLASVFAPLTEELLFRGWLYTGLRVSIGIPAAIVLTSLLFALAHWEETHLYALAIFPVGVALAVVRERTGSIAASIGFHALYNGFASAALIFSK